MGTKKTCNTVNVIRAEVSRIDDCPALGKLQAYTVPQSSKAYLEWTIRDQEGLPVDLTACFDGEAQSVSGESDSDEVTGDGSVKLRIRDIGMCGCQTTPYEGTCTVVDAAKGLVRGTVDRRMTDSAGIYQMSWGVFDESGNLLAVNDSLMSVEPNLFSPEADAGVALKGPPTISQLRLVLRDSSAAENPLLDGREFDAAELLFALQHPLDEFNDTPPPLHVRYCGSSFPWRHAWLRAAAGYLYDMAAKGYQRNHLAYSAAGISIDDKNKAQPYAAIGAQLLAEWREFILRKKAQINLESMYGEVHSQYDFMGGSIW